MATTEYEIGRIADRCSATGAPFAPGDPYVAALVESEDGEQFERRDFAPSAWDAGPKPPRLLAHWRGTTPTPDKVNKPVIDAPSLIALFEQLEGTEDPKRQAFRYVLALLLLRKRLLTPAGSVDASPSRPAALLVRPKGSAPEDPPMSVIDPAMDDATIAEITEQLRTLLRLDA